MTIKQSNTITITILIASAVLTFGAGMRTCYVMMTQAYPSTVENFHVRIFNGNTLDREFTCCTYKESGCVFTFFDANRNIIDDQGINSTWSVSIHVLKESTDD